jgi:hypothetical protein
MCLTRRSFTFSPKRPIADCQIDFSWPDIRHLSKITKTVERGVEVGTDTRVVYFISMKERDVVFDWIRLLADTFGRGKRSFGFRTRDDVDVVKRLTMLKAPHVLEAVVSASLQEIVVLLRAPEFILECYNRCHLTDVVLSNWTKDKNGLTRTVQYTQPMFQALDVHTTQTIMKSGDSLVFENLSQFGRPSAPVLLQMNLQFFFKREGETTSYRSAYFLGYSVQPWDKEFIEASINRQVRIFHNFLKAKINQEYFKESGYEGQWRKHQPYVLVILGLLTSLLALFVLKREGNLYRYLFSGLLLFCFFYQ